MVAKVAVLTVQNKTKRGGRCSLPPLFAVLNFSVVLLNSAIRFFISKSSPVGGVALGSFAIIYSIFSASC